jgi:hypothetical protein
MLLVVVDSRLGRVVCLLDAPFGTSAGTSVSPSALEKSLSLDRSGPQLSRQPPATLPTHKPVHSTEAVAKMATELTVQSERAFQVRRNVPCWRTLELTRRLETTSHLPQLQAPERQIEACRQGRAKMVQRRRSRLPDPKDRH